MRVAVLALAALTGAPALASDIASRPAVAQTQAPSRAEPTDAEIAAAIAGLANFDLAARTNAARVLRRASPARVMRPLTEAARSHRSSYVRYRSLALLAGLDDPASSETMRRLIADPDDRVRIVAAAWFEHHPDKSVLPTLVGRMADEQSEYVRPALTRAIAAHLPESLARETLLPLVERGEDFFRSAAIIALGEAKATFATESIRAVAMLDGPLQEDAIIALGRIGNKAVLPQLAALQREAPAERRPAIAAAVCMLGLECEAQHKYLVDLLKFSSSGRDPRMLRAAGRALAALAASGRREAFDPIFAVGRDVTGQDRDTIALAMGLVALRQPEATITALESVTDRPAAVRLLRDAFDLLSQEDYAQEQFFRFVRQAYWQSAPGSPRRAVAEALIAGLEI